MHCICEDRCGSDNFNSLHENMTPPPPIYRNLRKSEDLFKGPEPACPLIQSGATEFCSEIPTILPVVYKELIRESPGESVLPPPPQCRFDKGSSRERSYDSLTIQEGSRKARVELTKLSNLGGKSYPRLARLLDKISRSAQEEIELFKKQKRVQSLERTRQLSEPGRLWPSENQNSQQRYSYPATKESLTPNIIGCSYPEQIKGFNEYTQQLLKIKPQMPVATPVKKPLLVAQGPQRLRAYPIPTQTPVIKKPITREMSCPPRQTPHSNEYEQQYYENALDAPNPVIPSQLKDFAKFEKLKEDVERINRPRSNRANQQIQTRPYRSISQDVYHTYHPGYVMNNHVMSYQPYYGYSQQIPMNHTIPTQNGPVGSYQGYIPGYDQTNYAKVFNYYLPNY